MLPKKAKNELYIYCSNKPR